MRNWLREVKNESRAAYIFLLISIVGILAVIALCLVFLPSLIGLPFTLAVIAIGGFLTAVTIFLVIN